MEDTLERWSLIRCLLYTHKEMSIFTYRLVHYADHNIREDAELEEEAKLYTEVKGFLDVGLAEVRDQGHTFEAVREEGG